MKRTPPPITLQQSFWNDWNASTREQLVPDVCVEQADVVASWLTDIGRRNLNVIDVGCGAGWLCSRLTSFGQITGTDLSDQVLARAAERVPEARFVAGDFMELDFEIGTYDVATSLEVLSHVADQRAFIQKIAKLLKPGGHLMLGTQNKPALERNSIPPPKPGQLRHWVDQKELRQLLEPHFVVQELFSISPQFNRGFLRIVNSHRLRRLAASVGIAPVMGQVRKFQERAWLGWTLMALATKRA